MSRGKGREERETLYYCYTPNRESLHPMYKLIIEKEKFPFANNSLKTLNYIQLLYNDFKK